MTMTPSEIAPYHHLWASVLAAVIADYRALLQAAARRERMASIDGKRRLIASYQAELAHARAYFTSADAHRVAAMAGTELHVDRVMAYLTDGLDVQQEAAA